MQRRFWTTVVASALGVGLTFTLFVATTHLSRAQEQPPQNTEQLPSPLGTAFTYQGQLKKNGAPITANCLMAFRLYDQATTGNLIGSPITMTVPITNGLFTVQLDFGASVFAGEARWLGIQVQCPADAAYVDLGRQALTAAPYALHATSTGALQGRSVASTSPGNGQVLKWNGSAWSPADDAIGPPGSGDISAVVAGTGLSGGGTTGEVTLTVAFAGSGISTTVARSDHTHSGVYSLVGHTHPGSEITSAVANATNADLLDGQHASAFAGTSHNHLGQTWQGSNNPLVITGTFGTQYYAPLVLGNTHDGGSGVRVERADLIGVHVAEAGTAGVWVSQAGEYGVGVYKAGSPSYLVMSTFPSGFEVEGSEGYGLHVGRADMDGVHVWSAGGDGVHVRSAGEDGVDAVTTSTLSYGGRFVNSASGGAGLYARSGDGNTTDIELGSNSDTGTGDNGRIQSTDYGSSDLYLTSNDDVHIELDDDNDEGGVFRIDSQGLPVFQVEDNGRVNLANDAGWATAINIGDRYRDNSIVAWAAVSSNGDIGWEFGVASVTRAGAGNYMIELDAHAAGGTALIPIAIAEVESQPNSAATVRIVSINQTADNIFRIYINNGNWAPVDNDFVFMVTAR